MKVERKQLRKFIYISNRISVNMGVATIERVTSKELLDWEVYQYEDKHTVRTESASYEGYVETTTTTVMDFATYDEALGFMANLENQMTANPEYRTNLEH